MHDLRQFVTDLNQCWLESRFDDLATYFRADVVMLLPDGASPLVGVDAMVESYRQFASTANVHDFEIVDIDIYKRGPVAMCHLRFRIDYEIESGRFRESGVDVYAVETAGEEPQIVWRTQLASST